MADKKNQTREKTIIKTAVIGIIANILLASFKALVGFASHSTAMVLDAVNNTTDAISSIVTIVGTKLANRKPDKKHPLGHGRIEYLSEMIVAALILYAGITALFRSVEKVLDPAEVDYSTAYLIVVSVAIAVKIILGLYVRRQGRKAKSDLLVSSGTDALFDAILSTAVLASAIVYLVSGINIEAFVSIIISIFIIKTGVEIIREAVDDMLGHRVESELTKKLKECVIAFPEVYGVYDIILHNYGPDIYLGSLHIEIDDTMTADKIDSLTREINTKAYDETGIILTAVGIYSRNTSDDELMKIRTQITKLVVDHDNVIQMHGFYIDEAKKRISMDVVIDFAEEDREALFEHIREDVKKAVPGYEVVMTLDSDISDQ
jgi:cation diffusion facilitator family transporter